MSHSFNATIASSPEGSATWQQRLRRWRRHASTFIPMERVTLRARYSLAHFIELVLHMRLEPCQREWCRMLERAEGRRSILVAASGHGKSTCVSIGFPAYYIGHHPDHSILVISASADLAAKPCGAVRDIVGKSTYGRIFPDVRPDPERGWAESEWFVTRDAPGKKDASMAAMGRAGPIVSRRANLIIVDDLISGPPDVATKDLRDQDYQILQTQILPRLDQGGTCVITGPRWHVDDHIGRLSETGEWDVCTFPALSETGEPLAPGLCSAEDLAAIRKQMGEASFQTQYMVNPIAPEGAIFRVDRLARYQDDPRGLVCQAWDPAFGAGESNDYSCCATGIVKDGCVYVIDMLCVRLNARELIEEVHRQRERWNAALIGFEETGAPSLVQLLQSDTRRLPLRGIKAQGTKEDRARAGAALCEAGKVLLPVSAPWLEALLEELVTFPNGRSDDRVDALVHLANLVFQAGPAPRQRVKRPVLARGLLS